MKLRKYWKFIVDDNTTVLIRVGSNHPADQMFIRWATGISRTVVYILK
jgi:hypothetical protein